MRNRSQTLNTFSFFAWRKREGLLISEAVRGEGGALLTPDMRPFIFDLRSGKTLHRAT
jgi:aspartate oxidase